MADNAQKYQDASEVRVVDPNTGAEKGSKIQRYSLIPAQFLSALATHYGKGAFKYTKELSISEACAKIGNLCTCNMKNTALSVEKLRTQDLQKMGDAEVAMNEISANQTLNMQNLNVRMHANGLQSIEMPKMNVQELPPDEKLWHVLGLLKTTRNAFSQNKMAVRYVTVDQMEDGFILIMTIKPENSVVSYARVAIKGLGALETVQIISMLHQDTCKSTSLKWLSGSKTSVSLSGDRNWEKGYRWSLSYDAAMRHIHDGWLQGEDYDQETGSHHLICAIWHLITLYCYQLWNRGTDNLERNRNV